MTCCEVSAGIATAAVAPQTTITAKRAKTSFERRMSISISSLLEGGTTAADARNRRPRRLPWQHHCRWRQACLTAAARSRTNCFLATAEELRRLLAGAVAAGDAERRRFERELHDGAQQELIALAVNL